MDAFTKVPEDYVESSISGAIGKTFKMLKYTVGIQLSDMPGKRMAISSPLTECHLVT